MSDARAHEPEVRRDASQDVARRIRAAIQERGLAPGERLGREIDLAREFGVSRPTLREALRILSSVHLVRASKGPGGGVFVAATAEDGMGQSVAEVISLMLETNDISLEELLETRLLLEVPLAGLAAQRATPEDVAELRVLVDRLDATMVDDRNAFASADAAIHSAVARLAGNRVASSLTAWIVKVLLPSVSSEIEAALVEEVVVAQQRALVTAIEDGDAQAAEQAMRDHLVYTMDLVGAIASVQAQRDGDGQ